MYGEDHLQDSLAVRLGGQDVYRLAGRPDRSAGLAVPALVVAPHPAVTNVAEH